MKADPKAEVAAPKSSKKKLMLIAVLGVLVLGAAGGGAWYFTQSKPAGAEHKTVKAEKPEYVPIEAFTVNLQPENGDQYLQITFTLQVQNADEVAIIKDNMPKIRSRVLLILSGKKASEISTVDGKKLLAKEIIAAAKQPFVDKGEPQHVSDVLFTSFIIQ
ncbi:MAG: flagellar basal body-associated protein FliL [Massilia sp.]